MTAEFDARHTIDEVFRVLAERLEPIIAARLAPSLGGLPWTAILEERDRLRGKVPGVYIATDPQAQLKVLTERLGSLGFPFDDQTRMVSVLGGELRIMRNRWAHHGELGALDTWRTSDFAVRLLNRLGDADGTATAVAFREEAFAAVAREKGIAAHATPVAKPDIVGPVADASFSVLQAHQDFELVAPAAPRASLDFGALSRQKQPSSAPQPAVDDGAHEPEAFEPWIVLAVGDPDVIDGLPKKAMKEQVRAVAAEIVDFEGPIQLKRLVQLTAASFGIQRLREQREKRLTYQASRLEGAVVDKDKFVWPAAIDPKTWRNFRRNDPGVERDFLTISPVEIANAMRALIADGEDDVERATIRVFGKLRLTPAFRAHLAKARKLL